MGCVVDGCGWNETSSRKTMRSMSGASWDVGEGSRCAIAWVGENAGVMGPLGGLDRRGMAGDCTAA